MLAEESKENTIEEMKIAYRFCGRSLFKYPGQKIGIRFETFFAGQYYESYYVVLDMDTSKQQLYVLKHTIPYFIPLSDIQSKFLNTDIQVLQVIHQLYIDA